MFRLFKRRPDLRDVAASLEPHAIAADLDLIKRLVAFLETAEDYEVFHCNPRYLAERLEQPDRTVLKLLMAALYEGIITLHWEVRCPACGGIDGQHGSLHDLHHDTDCPACGNHFSPHLDDEVHITFSIHRRLRNLPARADDPAFRATIDARLGPTHGLSLLTLPDFQRLFPQQRLLPNESLDVTRVSLIFTDLAGSTAMYARRGDPRAYYLVRLHFDELFRVADVHGGTVVKTIGDAILGVFQTPLEAMQAALEMQHAIDTLNQRYFLVDEERLILKVGVHSGPCLSVTLNDRPDYFGTTVNTAARVQGLSVGSDLVFTEPVRTNHQVQAFLQRHLNAHPLESRSVLLKGMIEEQQVHRLVLPHGAMAESQA
ncbi:MAG: adenylate/guanylate cyclase domain-containing protein [Chloroflexaceae bacterium]|nr:adenylate/guanylate cyclase domain-containing protein [Chloroflexaceae bacterium]